jgi:hypothetical protein
MCLFVCVCVCVCVWVGGCGCGCGCVCEYTSRVSILHKKVFITLEPFQKIICLVNMLVKVQNWRHDTQHNDIQHDDIQHNDTLHDDIHTMTLHGDI